MIRSLDVKIQTHSDIVVIGTTPLEPIREGEHTPFKGPCSRVSNTSQYICMSWLDGHSSGKD